MTSLAVDAVYENGVLKPLASLPFKEHEKVRITIVPAVDVVEATAGILGWTGDAETFERLALDPEFGILESP